MRPAVRGQTNRYNCRLRLGRGFTVEELKAAGIHGINYARSIGIAIDLRRKDTCSETQKMNTDRIKQYISRIILKPRKKGDKKAQVKEATQDQINSAEGQFQNTTKTIIRIILF